jgi:hypothetical protein
LGKAIGKKLGLDEPWKAAECLACHANPPAVKEMDKRPDLVAVGVGCEACHGPGGGWVIAHTEPGFRERSWQHKASLGMYPVLASAPLSERVQVCAGCHIGATPDKNKPLRDMNHDMIAAGHPRLTFEYCAYLANMPPHWRKVTDPSPAAWSISRVASAVSALELLQYRAEHANEAVDVGGPGDRKRTLPWPEFAEFDCYACHHDLSGRSGRQHRGYSAPSRKPGAFLLSTWHTHLLPEAASSIDPQLDASMKPFTEAMHSKGGVFPASSTTKSEAEKAIVLLKETLTRLEQKPPSDFEELRRRLESQVAGMGFENLNWDEAAQIYFALSALSGKSDDLEKALKLLEFPPPWQSPKDRFPRPAP